MKRNVRLRCLATAALSLAACAHGSAARDHRAAAAPVGDWRLVATDADRDRIRHWRNSFTQALAQARSSHVADIAGAGPLLDPDAAAGVPIPPPGDYRCRVMGVGGRTPDVPDFVASPAANCRIADEGGLLSFAELDGPQRPVGFLFPDTPERMVFLGTMMLGDENKPLAYGRDAERDMAGAFERIGPARWRLVLPSPHWQSLLDVVELTPRA